MKTKAATTKAAAITAAYDAACAAPVGWTAVALAAYDAANAVYKAAYGDKVANYAAANIAAYDALDMMRIA